MTDTDGPIPRGSSDSTGQADAPRTGGSADQVRAAPPFALSAAVLDEALSPEFSARPFVPREWCPESTLATIERILRAEMLVTGNQ